MVEWADKGKLPALKLAQRLTLDVVDVIAHKQNAYRRGFSVPRCQRILTGLGKEGQILIKRITKDG